MRPSIWGWRKFKDFLHFYVMLGVIPLTILTTYANIVVGPATLTEIPEGYEPKHWEYYKNPVPRFFARYMIADKRQDYERVVCYLNEEAEKVILKDIEKRVKKFMQYRNDYKSWYYRPVDARPLRFEREEWRQHRDNIAGHDHNVSTVDEFSR
ncbi:unnamed protein product [Medioppia subpectinata]|uniref:NADH dehydrogenase [ubiquinone] 1 beta subcomplex subunit 5, mitochondrial n=1 Tax=Medioppia subpectinata TaxID=1979941 RepID=A0A7R9L4W9_9ACAR|nr:unnamed protein product [Medioppia subpectinata]CAG2114495.1 unnamed protein product [Medioppia subpectinata]